MDRFVLKLLFMLVTRLVCDGKATDLLATRHGRGCVYRAFLHGMSQSDSKISMECTCRYIRVLGLNRAVP